MGVVKIVHIEICVGSSCHLKGAQQVVRVFQEKIAEHGLMENVEIQLVGSFCQGNCTQGVNLTINGQKFSNVTPEKVNDIFVKWVLGGITHASHNDS
ncbi:MAG: (2Fe-2S) ferredoxin domain-containing protein [Peptococcales bacterium]|jgi:NADH:ubiquinone oxidoreductase subunit E